jgi:hypothetical protein
MMSNVDPLDRALLDMVQTNNAPIALSADTGRSRMVGDRIEAIRSSALDTPGSCYSHSSWGN